MYLKLFGKRSFDKGLINSMESSTYSEFCKKVYGTDLCQFNMLDTEQLEKLLELLHSAENKSILDLGCGAGIISEHLHHVTGAKVTGIDFAPMAISLANKRTVNNDNVIFLEGDLNNLTLPNEKYDYIIMIDTLYFIADFHTFIQRLLSALNQDGQMIFFYTSRIDKNNANNLTLPDESTLGKVLKKADLTFKHWNYTENEISIWNNTSKYAEELKDNFIKEGNKDIYKGRINETKIIARSLKKKDLHRFLYHVQT